MLHIDQETNTVRLTRGDTGKLTISIVNEDTGEPYYLRDGDTLTLTIKKSVKDESPLVQKVADTTNQIYIEPNDTKGLKFGSYIYDVQLDTSYGEVYTVIEPSTFEISREVT